MACGGEYEHGDRVTKFDSVHVRRGHLVQTPMMTNNDSPRPWWQRLLEWPGQRLDRWLERYDARVVLTLASQGPLTGRELKARGVLRPWNCYSVLHSLEDRGFIASELVDPENPPLRVYRLRDEE